MLPVASDGSVYLIGQWRYVLQRFTWEVIRGSGPVASDPLETAKRELAEETGFEANNWLEVLRLDVSPGITSEQAPCFVAWSLSQEGRHPDAQESLRLKRLGFRDAVKAVLTGDVRDAASVALILALHARLAAKDLPQFLAEIFQQA